MTHYIKNMGQDNKNMGQDNKNMAQDIRIYMRRLIQACCEHAYFSPDMGPKPGPNRAQAGPKPGPGPNWAQTGPLRMIFDKDFRKRMCKIDSWDVQNKFEIPMNDFLELFLICLL